MSNHVSPYSCVQYFTLRTGLIALIKELHRNLPIDFSCKSKFNGSQVGFVATLHVSVDPLCFFPDWAVEEERDERFQGVPI